MLSAPVAIWLWLTTATAYNTISPRRDLRSHRYIRKFDPNVASADNATTARSAVLVERSVAAALQTIVLSTAIVIAIPSSDDTLPQTGALNSQLDLTGRPTQAPLIPAPDFQPPLDSVPTVDLPEPTPALFPALKMPSADIFADPIDTKAIPPVIQNRPDHPVPRTGINIKGPLQTNKFYSNFFLGDRLAPTYTFPYSIAFNGGRGVSKSWGMSCHHAPASSRVFGPVKYADSASYYLNPVGIQSMIISAKELGPQTALSMDSITAFSARVNLARDAASPPDISFPLVQGMAYITGQYNGATPLIQTGVFFRNMTRITREPKADVSKYVFVLEDGSTWRLYAWKTKGENLELNVLNNGIAEAKGPFYGVIQIAKDPITDGSEKLLDDGAGVYPETLQVSGTANKSMGTYTFHFQRAGHPDGSLYMFALPHHVSSFDADTSKRSQKLLLDTTTKGAATLVKGNEWTMEEPHMPIEMTFAPWSPAKGNAGKLSDNAKQIIRAAAAAELQQNVIEQCNLDSMYFSGKVRSSAAVR